jgi:M6 family metalloprotease-like protein
MQKFLQVLVIWGLTAMAAPCLTSAIDLSRGIILDVPEEQVERQFGKIPLSQLTRQDSIDIASYRFVADTLKVLGIMVEWINRPGTYSRGTFDSLFFSRDVWALGSIADYYHEVSYGQVAIAGEVIDWYDAGWYEVGFDFESLLPLLDPVIDYSQFDGNNDGDVDAVTFIRSGNGMEDSGDWHDIWSHAYVYAPGTGPGPFDGVYVSRWNTSPETRPLRDSLNPRNFTGVDTLNRIRVFCHELAHCFGLHDLYDYDDKLDTMTYFTPGDYNDHPLVDWCVMGYGGYGLLSIGYQPPSHLCGWSKKELGWIDPIVLAPGTYNDLVIYNIETANDSSLYQLPIRATEGEYFLLEYRNRGSAAKFDKWDSDFSVFFWPDLTYGSDPLERGLLITHIDDSVATPWFSNNGTPEFPHYSVAVEDAGYNPSQDAWSNPEGFVTDSAQWWYPYETRKATPFSSDVSGQEIFSPSTYPNSDGYYGPSGIVVVVDSIVDDKLYAYVDIPSPAFSLLSPEDSAFVNYVVTFQWASPYPWPWEEVSYDLHVSTSSVFHPDSTVVHGGLLSSQHVDTLEVETYYWKARAYNNSAETWSTETWSFYALLIGDLNGDGTIDIADVMRLINYLFLEGSAPDPLEIGDANCDGEVDVADVMYLINYRTQDVSVRFMVRLCSPS